MKSILFALAVLMAVLTGPAHTRAQDADTPVSSDDPLAGTTWQLVSIGAMPLVEGSSITLTFNADGSSGGSAGCNGYGAGYTLDGDALTFEPPMSTMMYCEPEDLMTQESAYLGLLSNVTRYGLSDDGLGLTLMSEIPLVFERVGVTDVQWRLVSLNGAPLVEGTEVDLTLIEADQLATGFSGCNRFSGGYRLTEDGRIVFDALITTEMACADPDQMAQEGAYYAALSAGGEAGLAYVVTIDTLILYTDNEGGSLMFERVQPLDGTAWVVTHIMDEPVIGETPLTLRFIDGGVSGDGGCNTFGGQVRVGIDGSIGLTELVSTRRACVDEALNQQEARFFEALSVVMSFGIEGDSLSLFTHDGEGAVRATRQP